MDKPNPTSVTRGDVYDAKKADERIVEASGIPIEEIKAQHTTVFEQFKHNLKTTIDDLRSENYRLKFENARLKAIITTNEQFARTNNNKMSRVRKKRK